MRLHPISAARGSASRAPLPAESPARCCAICSAATGRVAASAGRRDADAATGGVQVDRGTAPADRAYQVTVARGLSRAQGELGGHAATAGCRVDRSMRPLREEQGDGAAGATEADALIRAQLRSYAAA